MKITGWLRVGLLLCVGGTLAAGPAMAQLNLTPDTAAGRSLGTQVIPFNGQTDLIVGGSRPLNGANLFHSFQDFNVREGRAVYFNAPTGVLNVFGRVTGSNPSNILGTLGTALRQGNNLRASGASLFLINPNGIIFGPNASLDVDRSFVATTASAIEFGNQGVFSASNPAGSASVLTIDPSAYLFKGLAEKYYTSHN